MDKTIMNKPIKKAKVKVTISNVTKAKELAKQGLNVKEVANALNINKYDASKLMKARE